MANPIDLDTLAAMAAPGGVARKLLIDIAHLANVSAAYDRLIAAIDKLKAAIALGALRVSYGDRDVTYRSLAEMRETLGMLQGEVDAGEALAPNRAALLRVAAVMPQQRQLLPVLHA